MAIHPQTGAHGIGAMTMLDGYHIFMLRPAYRVVAHLLLAERVRALRDPARRAAILAQTSDPAVVAADSSSAPSSRCSRAASRTSSR